MKTKVKILLGLALGGVFLMLSLRPEENEPTYIPYSSQNGKEIVVGIKSEYRYYNQSYGIFSQEELVALHLGGVVTKKYSRSVITGWPGDVAPQSIEEKYVIQNRIIVRDSQVTKVGAAKFNYWLLLLTAFASGWLIMLGWNVQTTIAYQYLTYWQTRRRLFLQLAVITIGIIIAGLFNKHANNSAGSQIALMSIQLLIANICSLIVFLITFLATDRLGQPGSTGHALTCLITYNASVTYADALTVFGKQDSLLAGGYFYFFLILFALSILLQEITIIRQKRRKGINKGLVEYW